MIHVHAVRFLRTAVYFKRLSSEKILTPIYWILVILIAIKRDFKF